MTASHEIAAANGSSRLHRFAPNPEEFELLGVNKLGERSHATPAFSNGEILIHTFDALDGIAEKS